MCDNVERAVWCMCENVYMCTYVERACVVSVYVGCVCVVCEWYMCESVRVLCVCTMYSNTVEQDVYCI